MDNTMYKIEAGFYTGISFGIRYDGNWVGKRVLFELGCLWVLFNFYSKQEKKAYPMKFFKWI